MEGFFYVLFSGSYSGIITKYNGNHLSIKIPEIINGISVNLIGNDCFANSNIEYIELPESVTNIGVSAFENSQIYEIKAIGVNNINAYAFRDCSNLYSEYMPKLDGINNQAFDSCVSLNKISFENSITNLGSSCFYNTGLETANMPNLIYINNSFEYNNIKSASFPKLKHLNGGFNNCVYLKELNIPNVNGKFQSIRFYICSKSYFHRYKYKIPFD